MGSERSVVCPRWHSRAPGCWVWGQCWRMRRAPEPVGSLVSGELGPCSRCHFSWARLGGSGPCVTSTSHFSGVKCREVTFVRRALA